MHLVDEALISTSMRIDDVNDIFFLLERDQLASSFDTDFGYVILNITEVSELFRSLRIISALRNLYIKHSFECFIV